MKVQIFGSGIIAGSALEAMGETGHEVSNGQGVDALRGAHSCIYIVDPRSRDLSKTVSRFIDVLEGCLKHGVTRVLFLNSIGALGSEDPLTPDSFHLPNSGDTYFEIPSMTEAVIYAYMEKGLSIVPLLIPLVVKDKEDDWGLLAAIRRLPVLPQGHVELLSAQDLGRAIVVAERVGRSGRRYLLQGSRLTTQELVGWLGCSRKQIVSESAWKALGLRALSQRLYPGALAPLQHHAIYDGERAQTELGFKARPIR